MKKILLLGGSAQQIVVIETAKKMGLYTILCDYLVDNPGQFVADKFYLISTTDKDAVLEIAEKEKIDGVLAYASDPAAPTAAYVAEKLDLKSNAYRSVEVLCNKEKFRKFLSENGFNTPFARAYSSKQDVINEKEKFTLPIIIKPVDSSGSKGATVINCWDELERAVEFAFSFSRCHTIIVEEFIEKKHPYLVGGDVFVVNGKIKLWGMLNCHRDQKVNLLVPVGKSYPLELNNRDIECIKNTLQELVSKLSIQCGAMNIELIIDKFDRVWLIDVGPRNGGNMIPDLLGMIFDIDIIEMTIKAAMGMKFDSEVKESKLYYATHNLHSSKNGVYNNIQFSKELEKYIIKKYLYRKQGDKVEFFDNASKALGIIFMKFETREEMTYMLSNINSHINIIFEKEC